MLKRIHIHLVCTCLMALIALAASAQQPAITDRLANDGQVTVDAPNELVKRNNSSLNGNKSQQQNSKKDKKKIESNNDDEKLNELDDNSKDEDKKKEEDKKKDEDKKKKNETNVQKPKRNHTSQQTIESRGVGYRIQAYTDNSSSGKANAQKRARDIAMKFPQYRSYISYKAPSWKLRIGDFKTQADAQAALRRIKSVYPQFARGMVIVKDRINVWSND